MKPWHFSQRLIAYFVITTVCHGRIAEGNYVLSVRTHSYANPNNHCGVCVSEANRLQRSDERGCCDAHNKTQQMCTGMERCDTYFYYCMQQLWNRETTCKDGLFSHIDQDSVTQINFTTNGVQGVPNPLVFYGKTNKWMGIQLFILVGDADGDPTDASDDNIVDIFHVNINSSIGTTIEQQYYHGIYNVAQIALSYEVTCAENFTGEFCEETDVCSLENINCSRNGRYLNELNDSFSCVCDPGFTGEFCQESIQFNSCIGVVCSENGQCTDNAGVFMCICDPGYSGRFCENNITVDNNIDVHQQSLAGVIIGGVLGGIVIFVSIVLLVVTGWFVLIKKLKWNTTFRSIPIGNHSNSNVVAASYAPGDNPVYGMPGEENIPQLQGVNARLPVRNTTSHIPSLSSSTSDAGVQHELQNPLYDSLESDNEYAIPAPVYATVETV